jgi:DNA-binding NtrC family response regulator
VLLSAGYRICEAACGREAIAVWERQKNEIALLLSDMVLPDGVSGRDLAQRFRSDKPGLKVLLTSGHGPEIVSTDTTFFREHNICFLRKPASAPDLARAVRQCLDEPKRAVD